MASTRHGRTETALERPEPLPSAVLEADRFAGELRGRLRDGAVLAPVGSARRDPAALLRRYPAKHRIRCFDLAIYLGDGRQNDDLRFFVAYLVRDRGTSAGTKVHPRLFYKDVSLVWRAASHFVRTENENWIGKGALKSVVEKGEILKFSDETTTDLPIEIQTAVEEACERTATFRRDEAAVELVLRRGGERRVAAFDDFMAPRRRAQSDPRKLVNRGRPIARFTREGDPRSLRFTAGFEPDFRHGVLERSHSTSRLYGGRLRRFRIASTNRRVQFLFFAGPRHAWIGACQACSPEVSTYGVRTIDASVPEDLLLPGYEYHFIEDGELVSQIPAGYVGAQSKVDPVRADASAFLEKLPVIQRFRRTLLRRR